MSWQLSLALEVGVGLLGSLITWVVLKSAAMLDWLSRKRAWRSGFFGEEEHWASFPDGDLDSLASVVVDACLVAGLTGQARVEADDSMVGRVVVDGWEISLRRGPGGLLLDGRASKASLSGFRARVALFARVAGRVGLQIGAQPERQGYASTPPGIVLVTGTKTRKVKSATFVFRADVGSKVEMVDGRLKASAADSGSLLQAIEVAFR